MTDENKGSIRVTINIQSNLFIPFRDRHISLRGSHYDGFTRFRFTKILGQVYFNGKGFSFNGHFYILQWTNLLSQYLQLPVQRPQLKLVSSLVIGYPWDPSGPVQRQVLLTLCVANNLGDVEDR